jgi:ribosomal protein S16
VAVSSYLPDLAGGMVAAASFADDAAAQNAIAILADSDVRPQEISVVARDAARAARIAGERAWYPGKDERGPARMLHRLGHRLPREVRRRYRAELAAGRIVLIAAAGGQPADTLAALLTRAGGRQVDQWWQEPAELFAPPELAGPF